MMVFSSNLFFSCLIGSPLLLKRDSASERDSPSILSANTFRRISATKSPASDMNPSPLLSTSFSDMSIESSTNSSTEQSTSNEWTVVKNNRDMKPIKTDKRSQQSSFRGSYRGRDKYYRSHSDQPQRKELEQRRTKPNYSEGDRPYRGRGRGSPRGRGRGAGHRGGYH